MLYPIGVQIPFAAQFTTGGAGAPGLTVHVEVTRLNADGSLTVIFSRDFPANATEIGSGLYAYQLAAIHTGVAGVYLANFFTPDAADLADVPALEIVGAAWVQAVAVADLGNLDAPISSRAPAGAPITPVSPLRLEGAEVTLICGDDYGGSPPALQRLLWTLPADAYPDLTGGSVALFVAGLVGAQGAGAVVLGSATGDQQVAVDFDAALSAGMAPEADRTFSLVATTATGQQQTLIPRGTLHIRARASS